MIKSTKQELHKRRLDPARFRDKLLIDTDSGPKPFGKVIEPWQQIDFQNLDEGWKKAALGGEYETDKPVVLRAWLERSRGHSKTQDIAMLVCYALFASDRPLSGVAAAGDLDQARLIRDAIGRLVHFNPWLEEFITIRNYSVTNPLTGSTLEIISSDAATSYGLLVDFVICDEVCHWAKRDLFDSLFSSAAKKSTCMFVVITNAGMTEDWSWDIREAVREDPRWYFSRLEGPSASWITEDLLKEQERLLPSIAFRRLWLNEWTSGGGDALTPEVIDRAFLPDLKPTCDPSFEYVAGLDLGVSRDSSAVCVLGVRRDYQGHGRIRLAHTQLWVPAKGQKVNLQDVEDTLFALHARFNFQQLNFDPWQALHMASRLQAGGFGQIENHRSSLPMVEITASGGNLQAMASTLIEAFIDGRVELYEEANLRRDLTRARVEERSYGFRLTWPRDETGHGDTGTAFCLALLAATDLATQPIAEIAPLWGAGDTAAISALEEFLMHKKAYDAAQAEMLEESPHDGFLQAIREGRVRFSPSFRNPQ